MERRIAAPDTPAKQDHCEGRGDPDTAPRHEVQRPSREAGYEQQRAGGILELYRSTEKDFFVDVVTGMRTCVRSGRIHRPPGVVHLFPTRELFDVADDRLGTRRAKSGPQCQRNRDRMECEESE